jgi:hypothetical protein
MGQTYLQRFEYRDGVTKPALDEAWGNAFKAFARTGNWGGVEEGVRHGRTYGTGWGGYVLIEADDPEAFGQYVAFHNETYGHVVTVTWEPLFDMDERFEETISALR